MFNAITLFRLRSHFCRRAATFVRTLLVLVTLILSPASWCACQEECSSAQCFAQDELCLDHSGFQVHIRLPNCCNEDDCPIPHSSQERLPSDLNESFATLVKCAPKSFQLTIPHVGFHDSRMFSADASKIRHAEHFYDGFAPQLAVPLRFCVMNS